MIRYPAVILVLAAICISGGYQTPALLADDSENPVQIDTPDKAAELSSRLANEKCQKAFGISPFSPESYPAQLLGSRWQWGEIVPPGIRGFSAEVGFNTDGSNQKIRVVLHTDALSIGDPERIPYKMEVIEQED
jgi:hypothetical protein